jgi:hypothetical protein
MLTKKDYCDYETCVALKELGYEGEGHYTYKIGCQDVLFQPPILTVRTASALGHILAVHLYSAQKWLREEKHIIVEVFVDDDSDTPITYNIYEDGECVCHHHGKYWSVKGWSEALSEGIKEAVKILNGE